MTAALLREAAALMRDRAEAATAGGPRWETGPDDMRGPSQMIVFPADSDSAIAFAGADDAPHIASWHPAVALAVAKAMEDVAQAWEISDGWVFDLDDDQIRFEDTVDGGWVAVARAYLGTTP